MIYKQKPDRFEPQFEVVSLLIENNGKILLLHRHPHKSQGNKWGVPAGKVDEGETLEEAMIREMFEETGVKLNPKDINYFDKVFAAHPEHSLVYHMYYLKAPYTLEVKINPYEHQAFKWVEPNEALKMNLIDDEGECIQMICSSQVF